MPRVIVNPGHRDERVHEIEVGATMIGRGRESDIRVANKSLSRQHARVEVDADGRATIRDVGSKNGTFVEGRRVSGVHELEDGQHFSCGDVVFAYTSLERSVSPPESPHPESVSASVSGSASRRASRIVNR